MVHRAWRIGVTVLLSVCSWSCSHLSLASAPPVAADEHTEVSFPTPLEQEVINEINLLRADPSGYARRLEEIQSSYEGVLRMREEGLAPIRTVEGVAPLLEAVAFLKQLRPMGPLASLDALVAAARDHVRDQGPTEAIGHRGSDGSNSFERISRHGRSTGLSAEVIDYGWTSAREIVMDLLIDDGIADRGHRRNLLIPRYVHAGAACGPHRRFGVMCVVEMAEAFTPAVFATHEPVGGSVAAGTRATL